MSPRNNLSSDQIDTLERLARMVDSPEKLRQLEDIMNNYETLRDVAQKEKNWAWFKKSARDLATLFLVVSAALYGVYETWIRVISHSVKKIGGG